jgi:hypothetical protein
MANVSALSLTAPSDYGADLKAIERRRQYAELLRQQSLQPTEAGQMVSGIYVKNSPLHGLAKALQGYSGMKQLKDADAEEKEVGRRAQATRAQDWAEALRAGQGTPEQTIMPDPQEAMQSADYGTPEVDPVKIGAVPGSPAAMYARLLQSQDPGLQRYGEQGSLKLMEQDKNVVVGRSLLNQRTGAQVGVDATWQQEQQASREQRAQELQMRLQDQRLNAQQRADLQRELQQMQIDARRDMQQFAAANRPPPQPRPPVAVEDPNNPGQSVYVTPDQAVGRRPMKATDNSGRLPASALKLQQEELDAVATASTITTDLAALTRQLDSGKLKLGPVSNLANTARNFVGASSEESRNLASLKASLEKLRNDSLRLNKGVQTEGDAVRAWNEVVTNINDPAVLKQRLTEIQAINQRAAALRRANVDIIRQNFGAGPLDMTPQTQQPPAVGGTDRRATERPAGRRVVVDY